MNDSENKTLQVIGPQGILGYLEALPLPGEPATIKLLDQRRLRVPASLLRVRLTGGYQLAVPEEQLEKALHPDTAEHVIPLVQEVVHVEKRQVQGDTVVVHVVPEVQKENVNVMLSHERVAVERISVNCIVSHVEQPRQEGDILIIPVYEEILVVEKRLLLKEEIRVTKVRETVNKLHEVELRKERVEILRSNSTQ